MKRLFLVLVVMLTLTGTARATNTLESVDAVRALVQNAMDHVLKGDTFILFNQMTPYWPLPEGEISDLIVKTFEQRKVVLERFGKTVGIVPIDERMVAETIFRITYVEKFERHIIRWVFTFYRPGDGWMVNSVLWDDHVDALFQ